MSQIEYLNVLKHHFLACYWTPINIYCVKYTTMTRHNKLGTDIRLNTNVLPLSCAVTALEVHRRPYREILTLTLFNLLRCSLYGGGFFCRWADTQKGGAFRVINTAPSGYQSWHRSSSTLCESYLDITVRQHRIFILLYIWYLQLFDLWGVECCT